MKKYNRTDNSIEINEKEPFIYRLPMFNYDNFVQYKWKSQIHSWLKSIIVTIQFKSGNLKIELMNLMQPFS